MRRKANETGNEQDKGSENEQQANGKEKTKRKGGEETKTLEQGDRKGKGEREREGKVRVKLGQGESKLQVGTNVMTAIVAEDGTSGTERLVEGSGTTTHGGTPGNGGKAAWWKCSKLGWVCQHLDAVGKHKVTKLIALSVKDWFLSWSANYAAARYAAYLNHNGTAETLVPAVIQAATTLCKASKVDLAPALMSTTSIQCSPATAAYFNNGPMAPAVLRACEVSSPRCTCCQLPFRSEFE